MPNCCKATSQPCCRGTVDLTQPPTATSREEVYDFDLWLFWQVRSERPAWLSRADCLHATLLSAEEHRRDTALADGND